jgi:hypothetical protein
MQTIYLKKFGNVLLSRPAGLEAFNAIRPQINKECPVQIDFSDVLTVAPSWFDEFLTQLADYMTADVKLLPTDNASVKAILPILAEARNDRASEIISRALNK